MRTLIDMNDTQVRGLDQLARQERRSRAAVIRAAIDDYLARHRTDEVDGGFGLWGQRKIDGLDFQAKARSEW